MTPAEKRALLFLALAALLGASVRLARTRDGHKPEPAAQRALALQIAAVDSARAAQAAKEAQPRKKRQKPSESAARAPKPRKPSQPIIPIVDLDEAPIALIDSLPGIGPVIAERIVADRNRNGPYGSLDELQRVKGIGPAMAERLSPYVTFSGRSRPNNAHTDGRGPAKRSPRPAGRR